LIWDVETATTARLVGSAGIKHGVAVGVGVGVAVGIGDGVGVGVGAVKAYTLLLAAK
jgi:hypothetical protein